jgi:hypothetical protein
MTLIEGIIGKTSGCTKASSEKLQAEAQADQLALQAIGCIRRGAGQGPHGIGS